MIKLIINNDKTSVVRPLDSVCVSFDKELNEPLVVQVFDGYSRCYYTDSVCGDFDFIVGGALGMHRVVVYDAGGSERDQVMFKVDCKTEMDGDDFYKRLLAMVDYTMKSDFNKNFYLMNHKLYTAFVCWCRDHVHSLKGRKYFDSDFKSGVEIFRDYQREDGMIWDNIYPIGSGDAHFKKLFSYGDFIRPAPQNQGMFKRIPVEADVEYLFVEGVYYTWKAYGDDKWAEDMLDACCKALDYCMKDEYRWSDKYHLIKRGFTVDTWDFVSRLDEIPGTHSGVVHLDKTEFGIMYGDNTGYAASCNYLADMYDYFGNPEKAEEFRMRAEGILERLDKLAWTGTHYKHHVPENPEFDRSALGVDLDAQISLSNTYSINRGIDREKAKKIIGTYKSLRENLPEGGPGEWFTIYPPYENFNGIHSDKWEYMNGGVITIAAGELAHGAFENGEEKYGIDILKRIKALGEEHDGYLHCAYKGRNPVSREEEVFCRKDISKYANLRCDLEVKGGEGIVNGVPALEMKDVPCGETELLGIPFNIPRPEDGKIGNAVAIGNDNECYCKSMEVDVNAAFASLYLLHAMNSADYAGYVSIEYEDDTNEIIYIKRGIHVMNWYEPQPGSWPDSGGRPYMKEGWRGSNSACPHVGLSVLAVDNPRPNDKVSRITFNSLVKNEHWFLFGVTLSNKKAWLDMGDVSFGIPDGWGAAALAYALIEGLAGVKDLTTEYREAEIAPKWIYDNVNAMNMWVRYPAGDGYAAYKYAYDETSGVIVLQVTGKGDVFDVKLPLPEGVDDISCAACNGKSVNYTMEARESGRYVCLKAAGGVNIISIKI